MTNHREEDAAAEEHLAGMRPDDEPDQPTFTPTGENAAIISTPVALPTIRPSVRDQIVEQIDRLQHRSDMTRTGAMSLPEATTKYLKALARFSDEQMFFQERMRTCANDGEYIGLINRLSHEQNLIIRAYADVLHAAGII